MSTENKSVFTSKTLIGLAIAWLAFKLKTTTGTTIPPEILDQVTNAFIEIGIGLAAIGRLVAKEKLI